MKIILMVGYASYEEKKKIADSHPDYLFIQEAGILNDESADSIMEAVKMVDAVMFIKPDCNVKVAYEVAAVMFHKVVVTEEMLEHAEREAEGMAMKELSDTAKQIIVDAMRNPM